ncbi:MAG TPA: SUMF1/EgtB/PvdO family nonheme iron enzyme, partial [Polyangiaceae bacterium]|nr:SUMF1/EgtB/PvdO family nonheme iron enzyme [Polyangiaceae bacterium]
MKCSFASCNGALGWAQLLFCVALGACSKDLTVDTDIECEAGAFKCDGKTLQLCGEARRWATADICDTEALCEKGLAAGECAAPVCTAGERRCQGAELQICAPGRDRLERTICKSADDCQRGLLDGKCVAECVAGADCPGEATTCRWPTCEDGTCVVAVAKAGTRLPSQTEGDCLAVVCDGAGETKTVPDDDAPASTECAQVTCASGSAKTTYRSEGTSCGSGGTCDGKGTCRVCTPGELDGCASSTAQRVCGPSGAWQDRPCPAPTTRCDATDGNCYAGSVLVWIAGGGKQYGIDEHEVSTAQYGEWLAGKPSASGQPSVCAWNTSFESTCPATNGKAPVACVDWCDAYAYCKSVGKRLCGKIGGGANGFDYVADVARSQWYNACSSGGANAFVYGNVSDASACNGAQKGNGAVVDVKSLATC